MGFGFEIDRMIIAGNAENFRPFSYKIDKKESRNVKKRLHFKAVPAGEAEGFNRENLNIEGDEQ